MARRNPGTSNETSVIKRRETVAEMYLRQQPQSAIAARTGVHISTISRDLKWLREYWLSNALRDMDEAKAQELARIDTLEAEYWSQYLLSKETRKRKITKGRGSGESERPDQIEQWEISEQLPGDPRYLSGIQWCIEQRCKILGIYSAVKHATLNIDVSNLTDDELYALAAQFKD